MLLRSVPIYPSYPPPSCLMRLRRTSRLGSGAVLSSTVHVRQCMTFPNVLWRHGPQWHHAVRALEDKYLARLVLGLAVNLFLFASYLAHCFVRLSVFLYRYCTRTGCVGDKMREVVALAFAAGAAASPFDKNKWHFEKKPHGWYVRIFHSYGLRGRAIQNHKGEKESTEIAARSALNGCDKPECLEAR